MAKEKAKGAIPNKHLHARISYLNQAAKYLATCGQQEQRRPVEDTVLRSEHNSVQSSAKRNEYEREPSSSEPPPKTTHTAQSEKVAFDHKGDLVFQHSSFGGLPLQLSAHLTQVARKSQIRLHQSVKHSICKRCNTPLIEGQTCSRSAENLSKGRRKPHADVLVLQCQGCGAAKRRPVGAQRQRRKTDRKAKATETTTDDAKASSDGREGLQGNG